jgi:tRNA(fMet)-specific endonuclease VapC
VAAPSTYLLDTNVLVHYVRASSLWSRIRDMYQPLTSDPRPIISVITAGELRSLAIQWTWGKQKLGQVEFALGFFRTLTIHDPDVLRMYATIDSYCEGIGQPLGKNDIWIAATAAATGARLVTTDRDYDRLTPRFLMRDWIDPDTTASGPSSHVPPG